MEEQKKEILNAEAKKHICDAVWYGFGFSAGCFAMHLIKERKIIRIMSFLDHMVAVGTMKCFDAAGKEVAPGIAVDATCKILKLKKWH